MQFSKAHFIHELEKSNNIYLNERLEKVDWSAVSDGNVRINGVGNKLYLVNFEKNLHPPEKKKFISFMKEKYGSILTNITTHLGDLVIELSIYVNKALAETVEKPEGLRKLISHKFNTDKRAELVSFISSLTD